MRGDLPPTSRRNVQSGHHKGLAVSVRVIRPGRPDEFFRAIESPGHNSQPGIFFLEPVVALAKVREL